MFCRQIPGGTPKEAGKDPAGRKQVQGSAKIPSEREVLAEEGKLVTIPEGDPGVPGLEPCQALHSRRAATTIKCELLSSHAWGIKASSSTTKLRVVYDGSAPTTSGWSLNDTLAVGPMLHPTLDRILLKFRTYRVALSGDIGKMYREILLSPADQRYHRFLWRSQVDEPVKPYCMNRVTFGVTCSPYLSVQTLQQAALKPILMLSYISTSRSM